MIDESFMIDIMPSTKLKRVLIKFALQHEGVTKIVEVNDKGEFNLVDEIRGNIFGVDDEIRLKYEDVNGVTHTAEVELESFRNDKILFKLSLSSWHWHIFFYNIGS